MCDFMTEHEMKIEKMNLIRSNFKQEVISFCTHGINIKINDYGLLDLNSLKQDRANKYIDRLTYNRLFALNKKIARILKIIDMR